MHLRRATTTLVAPFALSLAALALSACGSDSDSDAAASTEAPSSTAGAAVFALDEWTVTEISTSIPAGKVDLAVTNNGKEVHEIVIVRASDAASLPKKSDGSVDEDAIPAADVVGEIADLEPGAKGTATFDMPAGNYLALCNIVEDTMMGDTMHTTMGNTTMGNTTMGSGMDGGSGPATGHVHFVLGMVTAFAVG